jgi:hypothetical protein
MWIEVMRLLLPFLDHRENPKLRPIRLIGVRAERLARLEADGDETAREDALRPHWSEPSGNL